MVDIPNGKFYFYSVKSGFLMLIRKIIGREKFKLRKYNGKPIASLEDGNALIRSLLESDKAFLVARFGDGELRTIVTYLEKKANLRRDYPDYVKKAICNNAGFFPCEENKIDRFSELMLDSCSEVDVLAVWFNYLEDYVYKNYGPLDQKCIYLKSLESFWFNTPWTEALKGKTVLVVHPFAETIEEQYKKRNYIFQGDKALPEFTLICFKAVQSIGGKSEEFDTWFDAIDYMTDEINKMEFDVAILGCGAYGLPLGARLKRRGKKVIHLGGVTQFLFGIKGNRWDIKPEYASLYNEYWVRPNNKEKPQNSESVENGCYW